MKTATITAADVVGVLAISEAEELRARLEHVREAMHASQRETQRLGALCEEQAAQLRDAEQTITALRNGEAFHKERADTLSAEVSDLRDELASANAARAFLSDESSQHRSLARYLAHEVVRLASMASAVTLAKTDLEKQLAASVLVNEVAALGKSVLPMAANPGNDDVEVRP